MIMQDNTPIPNDSDLTDTGDFSTDLGDAIRRNLTMATSARDVRGAGENPFSKTDAKIAESCEQLHKAARVALTSLDAATDWARPAVAGMGLLPPQMLFENIDSSVAIPPPEASPSYSSFHVEPLLDRAASLLERGISARQQWDELAAKYAEHMVELRHVMETTAIVALEIRDGLYERPLNEAKLADKQATVEEASAGRLLDLRQSRFDGRGDLDASSLEKAMFQMKKRGYFEGRIPFRTGGEGRYEVHGYPNSPTGADDAAVSSVHLRRVAATLAQREINAVVHEATVALEATRAYLEQKVLAKQYSVDSVQKETLYLTHQLSRLDSMSRLVADRARLTQDDGVLNYSKRLTDLRRRFEADFSDAYTILRSVSSGMTSLYQYPVPLPATGRDVFDRCLGWIRDTSQFLLRKQHREQSAILCVPLRRVAAPGALWEYTPGNDLVFRFHIRPPVGTDWRECRVRGISANVFDGLDLSRRLYTLRVLPLGVAEHDFENGVRSRFDRSMIREVFLTRVHERSAIKSPDIFGANTLYNVPPWGEWELRISDVDWIGVPPAGVIPLTDIHLELHVVFIPAR